MGDEASTAQRRVLAFMPRDDFSEHGNAMRCVCHHQDAPGPDDAKATPALSSWESHWLTEAEPAEGLSHVLIPGPAPW